MSEWIPCDFGAGPASGPEGHLAWREGSLVCTRYVCMYPFIQRDLCLSQFPKRLFASSSVVESIIAVLKPFLNKRTPKSASSVTLNGSHPSTARKLSILK